MRSIYEQLAGLDEVAYRAREMSAKTVIVDVEPLVAYWESGQEALDDGVAAVLRRMAEIPGVLVVCLSTNSARRPSVIPGLPGARVVYLASAGKPLRTASYRGFPRPGVAVGDQVVTDGILARRLGYAFLNYRPGLDHVPPGPWLLDRCGRLVRPLLFTRRASLSTGSAAAAMPSHDGSRPGHAFLVMNPRSGGGKVTRFGLKEKAESQGADVALLEGPGTVDVAVLSPGEQQPL